MFKKTLVPFFCVLAVLLGFSGSLAEAANTPVNFSYNTTLNTIDVYISNAWTRLAAFINGDTLIDNFGAVGDGTTNDSAAFTAAATSLGSQGGTVIGSCGKNYRFGTSFTIPANVTWRHCRGWGGIPGVWGTGAIASQPHIKIDGTASITLNGNSGFEGVAILTGLVPPVQNASTYTGTAFIRAAGAEHVVIRALIVGFATCVDGSGGGDHYDWNIACDANPATGVGAIIIGPSFDHSYAKIHAWPYGTYAHATPDHTRGGIGVQILSGAQDESRFDLMVFGHEKALVTAGFGNMHFEHLWLEAATSYCLELNGAIGRSAIDWLSMNNCLGMKIGANTDLSIAYMFMDSASAVGAEGINIVAGINWANIHIGKWETNKIDGYAINSGTTNARIIIDEAHFTDVHGRVGPYIVGPPGWSVDQVKIGSVDTRLFDGTKGLVDGSALLGGNPVILPQVASGATMALPVDSNVVSVTGTAAINTINGAWGGREVSLLFESTASLTTAGNITLRNGIPLQGAAGVTVDLIYDQVANKWIEKGRNLGTAAYFNIGTSGTTVPFLDGNNTWSGPQNFSVPPKLAGVTIASLPTCNAGMRGALAWVDDTVASAAPTFHGTVAGGGATTVHSLASCDGGNWVWD